MKNLFLVLILMAGCSQSGPSKQAEIDSLANELSFYKIQNDSLHRLLDKPVKDQNSWFDKDYDGTLLAGKTSDPEKYIVDALRKRKDMIPLKAVLGGNMNFGNIQVLGSEWIIAEYDDGHILGRSLYYYRVNKNGDVLFKLLASAER
jgi:hypothetical protein